MNKHLKTLLITTILTISTSVYSQYLPNQDFDGDGIINSIDIDDDNDGLLDVLECSTSNAPIPIYYDSFNSTVANSTISLSSNAQNPPTSHTNPWTEDGSGGSTHDYLKSNTAITQAPEPSFNISPSPDGGNVVGLAGGNYQGIALNENIVTSYNVSAGQQYWLRFWYNTSEATNPSISTDGIANIRLEINNGLSVLNKTINVNSGYLNFSNPWVSVVLGPYTSPTNSMQIKLEFEVATSNTSQIRYIYSAIDGIELFSSLPSPLTLPLVDCDYDKDLILNQFDLDSDKDGCSDAYEGGATSNTANNYQFPTTSVGVNGLDNSLETAVDNGIINYPLTYSKAIDSTVKSCISILGIDTDNDGIADNLDIDDDNDGVLDIDECKAKIILPLSSNQSHYCPNCATSDPKASATLTATEFLTTPIDQYSSFNPIVYTNFISGSFYFGAHTITSTDLTYNFAPSYFDEIIIWNPDYKNPGYNHDDAGIRDFDLIITHGSGIDTVTGFQAQIDWAPQIFNFGGFNNITQIILKVKNSWRQPGDNGPHYPALSTSDVSSSYNITLYEFRAKTSSNNLIFCDYDGDGFINSLDLDSDNDGCSDAYEAGATTSKTVNYVQSGPYGTNGLANSKETVIDNGVINYVSTHSNYALDSNVNACLDSDNDGIDDVVDIDDDNDGVLDIEENSCTESNLAKTGIIVSKPSTINYNFDGTQTLANLVDGIDANDYIIYNPTGTLSNSEWFKIELPSAKVLTTWEVGQYSGQRLFSTTSTYKVQGSNDNNSWTDLTGTLTYSNTGTGQSSQSNSNIASFPMNGTAYKYYRYFGISGTAGGGWATEFHFKEKTCTNKDYDGDGIANHLDLDSDGDGCSDAYEAGATTSKTANYIQSGPYGSNGLANSKETVIDNGVINYVSTYSNFALDSNVKSCTDTDNDGISDLIDIDDDNDGVLDKTESIVYTCNTAINWGSFAGNGAGAHPGVTTPINGTLTHEGVTYYYTADMSGTARMWDESGTTHGGYAVSANSTVNYGVTNSSPYSIQFEAVGTITVTFDKPVTDPVFLFGSINGRSIQWPAGTELVYQYQNNFNTSTLISSNSSGEASMIAKVKGTGTTYNFGILNAEFRSSLNVGFMCTDTFVAKDTDGDGIINSLDLDSDNDGCSDALESSSTNNDTSNYQFPTTNVGTNGLDNSLETPVDSGKINYNSTYYYAVDSNYKICTATDLDSILDFYDIDDDNDGILDAVESPSCFYTLAEASMIKSITTDIDFPVTDSLKMLYDGNNSIASFNFNTITGGITSGKNVFTIEFTDKLNLTQVTISDDFGTAAGVVKLYGSLDGTLWKSLSTSSVAPNTTPVNLPVQQNAGDYRFYRVQGEGTGNTSTSYTIKEITIQANTGFMPSLHPKPICNEDKDADGIYNHLDLNSDNDDCSDAIEGGATTSSIENYVQSGPYGSNGLADSKETVLDNGIINYTLIYDSLALDSTKSNCCQLTLDTNFVDILPYSPTTCVPANDGYITIKNPTFVVGSKYKLSYYKDGSGPVNHPSILTADSDKTITINNLSPGKYSKFVIYDTVNPTCIGKLDSTLEYIINTYVASSPLNVNLIKTDANNSQGCNNGQISANVTGGNPPYTYLWSNGVTTATNSNLTATSSGTTYTVTVTDNKGCTGNSPYNSVLSCNNTCDATISMNSQTNIKCYGDASGSSVATGNSVSNPSSTFSFEWSNGKKDSGVLSSTLLNVLSGTYTVSVTINGTVCPAVSQSVVLSQPTSVLGATTSSKDETGPTTTDGEVSVSSSGGTLPYSYIWDDASMSTSSSVTGLDAGSYNVTVTDANGCSIVKSAVVNPGTCNNLSVIPSSKDITCYGLTNGELSSSVSGGSGNFTYTWMPGSLNGPTQTNVSKGTYTLTVLDNTTLCSSVNSISVAEPTQLSGGMAPSHVKCNGDSSGSIDLTVSGGISPYTYLWSTGSTTEDVIGLSSNTYLVIVTDKNGCTMTKSTTITEPSSSLSGTISPKASKISSSCNNGEATITVSGGIPPYTYNWSSGTVTSTATTSTSTGLLGSVSGITYTVSVTDANGCMLNGAPQSFVIGCTNNCDATISMNSQTNIKCYGDASGSSVATGNSVSNPSSTFSFEWSNGKKDSGVLSSTLINVLSGTYTVSVTINGTVCPAVSQSVVLSQPTSVLGATTSSKDETGPTTTDGEVSVSASGGTLPYSYKWDDASMSTSSSVTGLDAGSYNVTVTDANGCSIVKSAVVNPGTCNNLSVIPSSKDITCYGLTNGELSSSVSGGSGNFTYTWMPGSLNGPTQTNVSKGTYTLTVLDNTTLCSSVNSISVAEPTQLSGGMAPSHVKCNGDSSGSIDLTVSGGISPYTYLWSTGATTEDVIGLNSNTYLVIVTDKNGCTMTKSTTITEPSSSLSGTISPKAAKISSSCNNGEATITVSGGIPPYTYNWSSGTVTSTATTSTSTGLLGSVSGITYTVSVTDANGCMLNGAPQSFVIGCTNNCDATISMNSQTNIKCYGDASGSSVATGNSVSNPSSTFSFEWSNGKKDSGVLSSTLINVLSGTYTVSVTINGTVCPAVSQSVVLSQPTSVLGATTSSKDETGPTTTDGEVSVSASGGTLPYSYIWDDASMSTSSSVTGLDAGSYNVTVTDANGCSIVKSAVVNPGTCNNLSVIPSSKDITCYGLTNGELSSSVSGGSGNFTYTWMPGSLNGPTQTNVSKGTYTLTVLDNTTLCSSVNSISVAEPTQLSGGMAPSHVKCNGDSSGSIDLTVSGGISPYTYLWSTGATTEDVIGLSSNTYLVIVTDKNGCTMTKSTTITEPSSSLSGTISPKASKISSSCNNGEATITVSGGIPPYTYNWSSGTVTSTATTSTSTGLLGSVSGITYTVSVTDANGCMLNGAPQSFVIGCTNNCDATISMNSQTNIKCYGDASGSSVATGNSVSNPSSTFSFEWSNGKKDSGVLSSTLLNVLSGTYTVSVTINGTVCPAVSQSVVLSQPTSVLGATTSSKDETGPTTTDGEVSVSASGGTLPYSYKWDDASMSTSSSVTGLDAGSYNVTVTDANGCSIVKSAVVNPGTCNNLSVIPSSKDITCYGLTNGELSSSVSGGSGNFTYTWMPGSLNGPTQTNVSKGTYTLTVLDNTTLCSSVNSISVIEPTQLSGGMAPSHVKCNGDSSGSIDLTVSGGISPYTYLWSTGATTEDVIGLNSNTYLVIVTDKNGCTMTKSTTITEVSTKLTATTSVVNETTPTSNDGSASVIPVGGTPTYTYIWSNSQTSNTINNLDEGIYIVTVYDANGCSITKSVDLKLGKTNIDTITVTPICPTCSTKVCPPTNEVISTGSATSIINPPSGYTVVGPDKDGCYSFVPNGKVTDTTTTKIVICDTTDRCDTSVLILYPPVPKKDTIVITTPCSDCPVLVCPIMNDVKKDGATYSLCDTTNSVYKVIGPDSNGCFTFTSTTSEVKDTFETCIIICNGNRCDTTVVFLKKGDEFKPNVDNSIVEYGKDNIIEVALNDSLLSGKNTFVSQNATRGDVIMDGNTGRTVYRPKDSLYIGIDSFVYTVKNENGQEKSTIVYVYIDKKTVLTYTLTTDTSNKTYIDSNGYGKGSNIRYQVVSGPSNGQVTLFDSTTGQFIYVSEDGKCGMDSIRVMAIITYQMSGKTNDTLYYNVLINVICKNLVFPTYISPNGDGINDEFDIKTIMNTLYQGGKLIIYNRWGNIEWRSVGAYDGVSFKGQNYKGEDLMDGVYYYLLENEDDPNFENKTGFIEIMRN